MSTHPVPDERRGLFGVALRQLRAERCVSQSKLAERADYDHSAVSRWEAGTRTPTRDAITRLAAALTLTPDDTDRLLAAAGFLPKDGVSLLTDEPEVARVLHLLADPAVPSVVRDAIRAQLAGIAVLCQAGTGLAVAP